MMKWILDAKNNTINNVNVTVELIQCLEFA